MDIDTQIRDIVLKAIDVHTFPGAVVGYIRDGVTCIVPFGRLTYEADAPTVTEGTVYDLASVTKSIPTACVILSLAEAGKLSLDDPIQKFVPEMSQASGSGVLIRHLLTFTTALHLPQRSSAYATHGVSGILQAIFTAPLKYPPGQQYTYSDPPYILLGLAAERILQKPLDQIADNLFFKPLGMHSTTFHPALLKTPIAPTEINGRGIVVNAAHDEKAWAFAKAGRVAGHAGLFSTAADLLTFGRMLLNGGELDGRRYFSPDTVRAMWTPAFDDGTYGVSLGWRARSPNFIMPGLPPHMFGKEGFTGTMIMLDPDGGSCLVLLSNRTYPKRPEQPTAIQQVRRKLIETLFPSR